MLSVLSNLLDIGSESHVGAIHESVMLSAIRRALNIGSALSRGLSSFPFDTSFFSFYTRVVTMILNVDDGDDGNDDDTVIMSIITLF